MSPFFIGGGKCCCGCYDCSDFDAEAWETANLICDRALLDTDTSNPLFGPTVRSSVSTDCGSRITAWQWIRYYGTYSSGVNRCTGKIVCNFVSQDEDGWRYFRSDQFKTRDGEYVYLFGRSHACQSNESTALTQWWISINSGDLIPPNCASASGGYRPIWEMDSTYDPDVQTDPIYRIDHKWGTKSITTGWKFKGHNWPKRFYGPINYLVVDNIDVLQSGTIEVFNNISGSWVSAGTVDLSKKTPAPYKAAPSCQSGDHLYPWSGTSSVDQEAQLGWDCLLMSYAELSVPDLLIWSTYYFKTSSATPAPYDLLPLGANDPVGLGGTSDLRFNITVDTKTDGELEFIALWFTRNYSGLVYRPLVQAFYGDFDVDGQAHYEDLDPVNKTLTGAASRFVFTDVIPGSFDVTDVVYSQVD